VEGYNRAIGSLESRVLVSARRFRDLGAVGHELPIVQPVDQAPRAVSAEEPD
jgi:DNA recombination protein RmuC